MKRIPDDLAAKLDPIADDFLAGGDVGRMDAVAREIGVPRATLYYHFSGKDDLVAYFMRDKMGRVTRAIADALASEAEPLDRFANAVRAAAYELASQPAVCLNILLGMGSAGAMEELMASSDREVLTPLRGALAEVAAAEGRQFGDLDITVTAIMGGIYMAVVQPYARGLAIDADLIADTVVAQTMRGIAGR